MVFDGFSLTLTLCCFSIIIQGLLKKHEAFETDFTVHRDRCEDINKEGDKLIDEVNNYSCFCISTAHLAASCDVLGHH
jgi:hypothetical protein